MDTRSAYLPIWLAAVTGAFVARAGVRIDELVAGQTDRQVVWSADGVARLGAGPAWYEAGFDDSAWFRGPGGIGFGDGDDATDVSATMQGKAVSLYVRRAFVVSAGNAARTDALHLTVDYDDGFVAYLNGRELLRKNLGPYGAFVYYDQVAYNAHEHGTPADVYPGPAAEWLIAGTNILAVQVHNATLTDADLSMSADLTIDGSPAVTLVAHGDEWRYQVGTHEPSGGFRDPAFLPGLKPLRASWAELDFDASTWASGPGGIGYGDLDDATDVQGQMQYIAHSLYMRQTFVIGAAAAASTNALSLAIDYDDGFVAYLNGAEIARRNLGEPGDFVAYDSNADGSHEAGTAETIALGPPTQLLVPGTNVLAVQVHNDSLASSDLSMIADLWLTGKAATQLVAHGGTWRYAIGTAEPGPIPSSQPGEIDGDFLDWVELFNTGPDTVDLSGWSLTDNADEPRQWQFPNMVLAAGRRLVVCCTGRDIRNPFATYLHTNFKLSRTGEYLGLYDADGHVAAELAPGYPEQTVYHSYGWDETTATYRYFETPTPGAANTGTSYAGIVAPPVLNLPAGLYDGNQIALVLTTATANATIRFTTDGTDPTATNGGTPSRWNTASLTASTALRAAAFKPGYIPSPIVTRTYLLNVPAALRTAPIVSLVGDFQRTFHKPYGVTSIVGGQWVGGLWQALTPDDYDIPIKHGRPYERPVHAEFIDPTDPAGKVRATDCGLRVAGSAYTRPRYILQDMGGLWSQSPHVNKPQFNLYFRDEYGKSPFKVGVIPTTPQTDYESLRLRGGKNDYNNPFIADELARRLYHDMGQVSSLGVIANLYVNGQYRCYYNPCERYDEYFLQEAHHGGYGWDIISHADVTEGDSLSWQTLLNFMDSQDLSSLEIYQQALTMIDEQNFIDYIVLNSFAGTWDWPQNNWYAARERSPYGRFRYYVWDAEGALGQAGGHDGSTYNTFTQDLLPKTAEICRIYRSFFHSPEFRLHFADRVQKQMFGDGALTDTHVRVRLKELVDQMSPTMQYYRGVGVNTNKMSTWINVRRDVYFSQLTDQGLWPGAPAPTFAQPGGQVEDGFVVEISAEGRFPLIYYTLDETDPRAPGGAPSASALVYTGPFALDRSRTVKARLYQGTTWSPLAEAVYVASPPTLVVSEIMYNPPGGSDYEFVELHNPGTTPVSLASVAFQEGIYFDFAYGDVSAVPPGGYVVLVGNRDAFAERYDTNSISIAGTFDGKLDDGGEHLTLVHRAYGTLQSFSYDDDWYKHTDGDGFSLTIVNPSAAPEQWDKRAAWRASAWPGGTPGTNDNGRLPNPGEIVINEILTHTDASPVGDWVELLNTTAAPIPIGGWYLSDAATNLCKYRIPDGTVVPAGGMIVFDGTNNFDRAGQPARFAFSEFGEHVYLTSGTNALGELTGFRAHESFDAADREVTFGRHVNSNGDCDFVAMAESTPGAENSAPKVGPVVISEIMYAPASNRLEYIECYNVTAVAQPLYHPVQTANTWRVAGGIDYTFPPGVSIPPFSSLLVVGGDPAAFRASRSLPPEQAVYGPFAGRLDNAGESVSLCKPGDQDDAIVPQILVNRIRYNDKAPWPEEAAAGGISLERIARAVYGNDPANWRASAPGGSPEPTPRVDSDGDGIPDVWEAEYGLDPMCGDDAARDTDGDGWNTLAEYLAGSSPSNNTDTLMLHLVVSNGIPAISFDARAADGPAYDGQQRIYVIEGAQALAAPAWWSPLAGLNAVTGDDARVTCTDDAAANIAAGFYRVRARLMNR